MKKGYVLENKETKNWYTSMECIKVFVGREDAEQWLKLAVSHPGDWLVVEVEIHVSRRQNMSHKKTDGYQPELSEKSLHEGYQPSSDK